MSRARRGGTDACAILCLIASAACCCAQKARSAAVDPSLIVPPASPAAHTYLRIAYLLYFLSTFWMWFGIWSFARRGWSRRWRDWAELSTRRGFGRVFLYYLAYSFALLLWMTPFGAASALLEARYGFSTRTVAGWLSDRTLGYAVGLTNVLPVAFGYWLIRKSPNRWWLWLWAASIPWMAASTALEPVAIAPLYNQFRPLPPGALRDRLTALARRAGIGNAALLVVDSSQRTRKQNAYVSGLGPTQRIVLWDTLIRESPPDQVEAVVAHEIGHYVLGHVWRQLAWNVLGAGVTLWALSRLLPPILRRVGARCGVRDIGDLASFPLVALTLSVLLWLQSPISAALSRSHEREADRYGVRLTHNPEAAARQFVAFVRRDYADPDPPPFVVFWFYSHPPIRERVAAALSQR